MARARLAEEASTAPAVNVHSPLEQTNTADSDFEPLSDQALSEIGEERKPKTRSDSRTVAAESSVNMSAPRFNESQILVSCLFFLRPYPVLESIQLSTFPTF